MRGSCEAALVTSRTRIRRLKLRGGQHEVSTEVSTLDTYMLQLEVGRVWPMSPPSARCAVVSTASSLLRPAPPLASRYHPPSPDTSHTIPSLALPASFHNSYCYLHVGV